MGPQQLRAMLLRELAIAGINGAVWGSELGAVTFALYQNWKLAAVIGAATLLELLLDAAAGLLIPVTLKRFVRDPIMGSSVVLSATTDSLRSKEHPSALQSLMRFPNAIFWLKQKT